MLIIDLIQKALFYRIVFLIKIVVRMDTIEVTYTRDNTVASIVVGDKVYNFIIALNFYPFIHMGVYIVIRLFLYGMKWFCKDFE